MKVIDELDRKKDDSDFSERAKKAIKKINEIEQSGGRIKDDVVLEIFGQEYHVESSADETIVRQTLDYASSHHDEDVYIMTEDYGMQLRCKQRVKTIEPDKTKRQISPKSKLQKENLKLKTELTRLQNQIPVLNLIITQPNSDKNNSPEPFRAKYYSVTFAEEKMAYHEYEDFVTAIKDDPLISSIHPCPYPSYQTLLVNYVKLYNKVMEELSTSFPFNLQIENAGRAPAENISICIKLPKIFRFIACGEKHYGIIPDIPQKPRPPIDCSVTQRMPIFADLKSFNKYYNFHSAISISDGIQTEFSDDSNNIIMHIKIKKILHCHNVPLDCIAGVISTEKSNNFELKYEIFAENMPDKKEGKIPIILIKENT